MPPQRAPVAVLYKPHLLEICPCHGTSQPNTPLHPYDLYYYIGGVQAAKSFTSFVVYRRGLSYLPARSLSQAQETNTPSLDSYASALGHPSSIHRDDRIHPFPERALAGDINPRRLPCAYQLNLSVPH